MPVRKYHPNWLAFPDKVRVCSQSQSLGVSNFVLVNLSVWDPRQFIYAAHPAPLSVQ